MGKDLSIDVVYILFLRFVFYFQELQFVSYQIFLGFSLILILESGFLGNYFIQSYKVYSLVIKGLMRF